MTYPLTESDIARLYVEACRLDVAALKPGNVHRYASGHGMDVADFETSADVTADIIADQSRGTGARIRDAVEVTFEAVSCNTNLGILLLTVPLAKAAGDPAVTGTTLPARLGLVLDQLDADDAGAVFTAIARANPGGLGSASQYDVHAAPPPDMSLRDAMVAAADRDLIAAAYRDRFAPVLAIADSLDRIAAGRRMTEAVTLTFLDLLADRPDTHIARKHGPATAAEVRDRARNVLMLNQSTFAQSPFSEAAITALLAFDRELKSKGFNPGTLADLIVAAAFARSLRTAAGEKA